MARLGDFCKVFFPAGAECGVREGAGGIDSVEKMPEMPAP